MRNLAKVREGLNFNLEIFVTRVIEQCHTWTRLVRGFGIKKGAR